MLFIKLLLCRLFNIPLNLKDVSISHRKFVGINFNKATLVNVKLSHCQFISCQFDDCTMTHCVFEHVQLDRCIFLDTKIESTSMLCMQCFNLNAGTVDIKESTLKRMTISDSWIDNINLTTMCVVGLHLIDSSLDNFSISQFNMPGVLFNGVDKDEIMLHKSTISDGKISDMFLRKTSIEKCEFSNNTGTSCHMDNCSISECLFKENTLKSSVLHSCDINTASVQSGRLDGVILDTTTINQSTCNNLGIYKLSLNSSTIRMTAYHGGSIHYVDFTQLTVCYNVYVSSAYIESCTFGILKPVDNYRMMAPILFSCKLETCFISPDYYAVNSACPLQGAYSAWKFAIDCTGNPVLIKLHIPERAKRISPPGSRKCRASEAEVVSIIDSDGDECTEAHSWYDPDFKYVVGKVIKVENFDSDKMNTCSAGIHHYMTRTEAEMLTPFKPSDVRFRTSNGR